MIFDNNDKENTNKKLIEDLLTIKKLVSQPKEKIPEQRFLHIKKHLNDASINETIKEERWTININCPKCESTNINVLLARPGQLNKYKCNNCEEEFNDSSGEPFENTKFPLHVWIECWYLYGMTNSIEYIASKLDLDVHTVRLMISQLQKIFKVQQPLTKYLSKEKDLGSIYLREIAKQVKQKEHELMGGPAINQAKDTAEARKMENRKLEESGLRSRGKPKSTI